MKQMIWIVLMLGSGSLLWAAEGNAPEKTPSESPFDPAPATRPARSEVPMPPTTQPAPETVTLNVRWPLGRNVLVMLNQAVTEVQPEEQQAVRSEAALLLVGELNVPAAPATSAQASSAVSPTHKGTFRFVRIAQRQKTNVGPIHDVSFDTDRVGRAAGQEGGAVGNLGPLGMLLDIPYTVEFNADRTIKAVRGFDAFFQQRKPPVGLRLSFGDQALTLLLQRGRRFTPDDPSLAIKPGVQWKKTDSLNLPAHGPTEIKMEYIAKRFYGGGKNGPRKLEIDSAGQIDAPAGKTMKTQYGSATVFDLKGTFTGKIHVAMGDPYASLVASDTSGELEFMQKMKITATGKTIISETKSKTAEVLRVYSTRNKEVENRLFNPPKPKKDSELQKAQSGK